jgi:O-antigen/teichoic acid export membrane protein
MRWTRLSGRPFLNNALLGAGSIAAGQLLFLLAMPLLARRYSPSDFGIYASVMTLSGIIGVASSLRADMALPATLEHESHRIYRAGLWACMLSFLTGLLVVLPGWYRIFPWPDALAGSQMALLCLATGSLQGLMSVFSGALVRSGQFKRIAVLRLLQPSIFVAAALAPASGDLTVAYAVSLIATASAGLLYSWNSFPKQHALDLKALMRKYWEYPVISLPVAVLDTLALSMPLLFIVQHYGEAAGGNYSQVQRLLTAPLLLCAMTVSQVFYKHAGDLTRAGDSVRPLMWKTVGTLVMGGMAVSLLSALIGEPVLNVFLGGSWRTDARYLLLIVVPAACRLCVSPITSIFLLTGNVRLGAFWQVAYAASMWSILSFSAVRMPLDQFLLTVLVSEFLLYALYLWMADVAVRRLERGTVPCAA